MSMALSRVSSRASVSVRCMYVAGPASRLASAHHMMAHLNPSGQRSSFHGNTHLLPSSLVPTGKGPLQSQGSAPSRMPALNSFLGVGAPEAVLIGVVALVVFGPKGLAEAAKSVGSTLRQFQPTIKEVVQVSQELKGSLEKELGFDELREAARPTSTPRPPVSELEAAGPLLAASNQVPLANANMDPDIDAKRKASMEAAWAGSLPSSAPLTSTQELSGMSIADLEAELARRKAPNSSQSQA